MSLKLRNCVGCKSAKDNKHWDILELKTKSLQINFGNHTPNIMGFGFVILIHLIAIFLISAFIALIWVILTRLLSRGEKQKRKMLFAAVAPFIGLYTLYFLCLFGSMIISEIKGVDIGIGDSWYVPIRDNCKLTFIDLPEQSYLVDGNNTLIEGVEYIQQTENSILGKTYDSIYFSYDFETKDFKKYKSENELLIVTDPQKLNLKKAMDFYIDKRNAIAGPYFVFVGIISFFATILGLWVLRKLMLGQLKKA